MTGQGRPGDYHPGEGWDRFLDRSGPDFRDVMTPEQRAAYTARWFPESTGGMTYQQKLQLGRHNASYDPVTGRPWSLIGDERRSEPRYVGPMPAGWVMSPSGVPMLAGQQRRA
jgi:hypothetical protein